MAVIPLINCQARKFLEHFHETRRGKLRYDDLVSRCSPRNSPVSPSLFETTAVPVAFKEKSVFTYAFSCTLPPLLHLSLLLDGERWKQADVPTEIQSLAQQIEAGVCIPACALLLYSCHCRLTPFLPQQACLHNLVQFEPQLLKVSD